MSAQFEPGETVRFTDLNRAVGSPFWPGAVYTVNYVRQDGMVSIRGIDKPALAKHFEKVEHAEPEDKDDLYVEPEPLKEGDWVQVWARIERPEVDEDGEILLVFRAGDGGDASGYAHPDAIVRPDAGQVPPWVKPAQCTSLLMIDKTTNLRQCTRDGDDHDNHVAYGASWKDHEAYGRVVVSDGAS